MQPLQAVNNGPALCAADLLLEAVPGVMLFLRATFRRHVRSALTITQVRALAIVRRCGHGTLTEIADLLGISSPAASRLVEAMVAKRLISRQTSPRDRRRLSLRLTPAGEKALEVAMVIARKHLAARLEELSKAELATVQAALTRLDGLFRLAPCKNSCTQLEQETRDALKGRNPTAQGNALSLPTSFARASLPRGCGDNGVT